MMKFCWNFCEFCVRAMGYLPELKNQYKEGGFIKEGELMKGKCNGLLEGWSLELGGS